MQFAKCNSINAICNIDANIQCEIVSVTVGFDRYCPTAAMSMEKLICFQRRIYLYDKSSGIPI